MAEEKVSKVEVIKAESHHLRGTLDEALQDGVSHFAEENIQVLKFHGVYQQDDRDLRKQLTKEGKERHYMMMVRARIPGGILSADQYLQFDALSEKYGNQTMKVTTRQTFQLHGILKGDLKSTIKEINDALVTTLGGCGDQVRNTIACAEPHEGPFYDAVRSDLLALVNATSAKTNAYHEIWLDGEKLSLDEQQNEEPFYGDVYLPRKFKLAFTYEGDNCADIYSNDIGIVAHRDGDNVAGYTLVIGGGMGRNAADAQTKPLLAKPFAFVTRDKLIEVCKAVITVQRDHGNRVDRKWARMKYLVEDKGIPWFTAEAEKILGYTLTPPRELVWNSTCDHLGHHSYGEYKAYVGLFIENGRIHDTETLKLKTALRELIQEFKPTIHLTTQQNLIFADLTEERAQALEAKLKSYGLKLAEEHSKVKLDSMACVALPTCGLAVAESERVLPSVITELEQAMKELGLEDDALIVRMTGCPNGCARPYIAELAFVGRAIGKYDVFLGANPDGTRTNTRYKELVPLTDLVKTVRPLLLAYREHRASGERFGNFVDRVGFEQLRELEVAFA